MKFCSNCGSDRIGLSIPEGDNRPRFVCPDCKRIHYQNPNMVVGCLATWEGKILLAKRAIEPRYGYWNLPAGYLENGETAEDGAIRETMEETKAEVDILGIHCIYSIARINQIYVIFLADMKTGEFELTEESLDVKLFAPKEIPWEQIAFPSSVFALKKYLKDQEAGIKASHIGRWEH